MSFLFQTVFKKLAVDTFDSNTFCFKLRIILFQGNNLSMKQYLNQLNKRINEIIIQSRIKILKSNQRSKFSSLLILDVHHRDIIESFVINKYLINEKVIKLILYRKYYIF